MPREEYIRYYEKTLGLGSEDFQEFCLAAERRLPHTFRITESPFKDTIRRRLEGFPFLKRTAYLRDVYEFCRGDKDDAVYKAFMSFLVDQTAIGLIQRQEIVSMVPVMLLDIREDSRVLEMCAAPGSKTKQILETVRDSLVVANDQSGKRLNILVTETSKKPCSSLVITKHDASLFPNIWSDRQVRFNRVLCDVPCSSDGTVRKSPNILYEWDVNKNAGLFGIQSRILKRGCELLEEDGLIAYSTCSLNPMENECVVQKILLEGEFEVVDLRSDDRLSLVRRMDKLVFREGLKTWGTDDKVFENSDFQPVDRDLGLEKCIRLYPHDQDTGGFFIAILRRKGGERREHTGDARESPRFCFLSEELKSELLKEYSIQMDVGLYRKTAESNSIYAVSAISEEILRGNPKLRVISAGYRLFESSGLEHSRFYLKNLFHVGSRLQPGIEISPDKFRLLLAQEFVSNAALGFECMGVVVARIGGLGITLCGYGNTTSFTLFMNRNLRKALHALVEDE